MENVLTRTIFLVSRDCDFTGCWKPSEIFMAMQEMAAEHSGILGAGYSYMRSIGLAFALTRTELRMNRYPRIGENVVIRTWAAPVMKWMYPRHFIFESETGEQLGFASTIWVLLDLNERKMVAPSALDVDIATGDLPAPLRMPGKALAPDESCPAYEYLPGYSEIDVNSHVNNTRYVSWMCDRLGVEVLGERHVGTLIVNYSHEILPGRKIDLRAQMSGDNFCMSGDNEGVNHFTLSGTLQ